MNPEDTTPPPPASNQPYDLGEILDQVWNMRLFSSGDHEVQFNQLVIALGIIVLGIMAARIVAGIIGQRLGKLPHINRNTAYLIRRLLFFIFSIIVILVALPIAGIPITIFTVLGGALAIGVGFGAQNIFNNLISGILIMTTRPIRLGDILEIDDSEGRVEDIGTRITRVRRSDGVDVLIPNSHFLENQVINWTLQDGDIRGAVTVGVAYGSPCRRVEALLVQAANEHPKTLKAPAPFVLFEEFGDNSLVFSVLFWTQVQRPMDMRRLQSDLRFRIDELCRENDIVIAFPQRDVHLDTLKPLEIKLQQET